MKSNQGKILGLTIAGLSLFQGLSALASPTVPCFPPPSGIVAWYQAENNANDLVFGNNGTLLGGLGFSSGEVSNAFNFTNDTQGVLVPASSNLNVQSITIECWINPTDVSDFRPIVEYADDTSLAPVQLATGWDANLGTTPGGFFALFRTPGGGLSVNSPGGVLPTNQWSHIAVTFDYDTQMAVLYLNGAVVDAEVYSGGGTLTPETDLPVHLGYRPNTSAEARAGTRHSGGLDEVSIYNRALTECEIQSIYLVGPQGKCH